LTNCWMLIFLVLPKLYGCQVGLPNCWSCSKMVYMYSVDDGSCSDKIVVSCCLLLLVYPALVGINWQPVRLADGWCWFVLREEYCWLVAGGWFVLREKYCWLVADKPSEQALKVPSSCFSWMWVPASWFSCTASSLYYWLAFIYSDNRQYLV
jgi:hypothetical protein